MDCGLIYIVCWSDKCEVCHREGFKEKNDEKQNTCKKGVFRSYEGGKHLFLCKEHWMSRTMDEIDMLYIGNEVEELIRKLKDIKYQ